MTRPQTRIVALFLALSACGPEMSTPTCERVTKPPAELEGFIVGDWICEAFNVDELTTHVCTFLANGRYAKSDEKICGSPDDNWATWRVDGDAVYLRAGTLSPELFYQATVSESEIMLDAGDGIWLRLRAADCSSVCAGSGAPGGESTP